MPTNKNKLAIILITSLFFLWGFVHNLDPILIPHLRKVFSLSVFESSLVDSSIFIAYFIMALPAGMVMHKYGYKSGILLGLLFFAVGSFLFIPAANTMQYIYFLGALFVIACGLTFLETAANPYVTVLGSEETAARRLNFSQSFNGLAAVVAPIAGKWFLLKGNDVTDDQMAKMDAITKAAYLHSEAASVKMPYFILGLVILVVAVLIYFTKLPDITDKEEQGETKGLFHAFAFKQLRGAVIAQFFYVGAQVCVGSFFVVMVTKAAGISKDSAANYLAVYGLAFMMGRFVGTFFMQYIRPNKLLCLYALINVALTLIAVFASGMVVVYALIGIAFFMSIMFPTIFSLGIRNLGADTKNASSLIVMSIVGGALLPPVLGKIADATNSIQYGYLVALVCFIVIAWFAVKGYKTGVEEEDKNVEILAAVH